MRALFSPPIVAMQSTESKMLYAMKLGQDITYFSHVRVGVYITLKLGKQLKHMYRPKIDATRELAYLQRLVLAMPSAERQKLVAICLTLALTSRKCLEPNRTATVNRFTDCHI